jgi:tripartite-type tricarboxylate transporter receptor subunit TctC
MNYFKYSLKLTHWLSYLLTGFIINSAQAFYPEKPITLIVPFAPGGANDILGRIIGQSLSIELKQSVIVENKPGAGTTIGAEFVANAKPDGYTLLLVSAAHVISSSIYSKLRYDPIRNFTPVAQLTNSAYVLVTSKDSPIKSVQDIIKLASKEPNRITYASSGIGSAPHLAGALLAAKGGIDLVHIPYKGGGPALLDVIRGDTDIYFASQSGALPFIQSDKLRALGVSTSIRTAALQNIPTIKELGIANFELAGWYGIVAPSQTASTVVQLLNNSINQILGKEAIQLTLAKHGEQAYTSKPEIFGQFLANEQKRYQEIIQIAKVEKE